MLDAGVPGCWAALSPAPCWTGFRCWACLEPGSMLDWGPLGAGACLEPGSMLYWDLGAGLALSPGSMLDAGVWGQPGESRVI